MKLILALVLLFALISCEDVKITLKSGSCTANEANDGAILMKGNNKVIVTLEASTSCTTASAAVKVERRQRSVGVKVDEYYTGGKWTTGLKWDKQIKVSNGPLNQNGDEGSVYLAPKGSASFKGINLYASTITIAFDPKTGHGAAEVTVFWGGNFMRALARGFFTFFIILMVILIIVVIILLVVLIIKSRK